MWVHVWRKETLRKPDMTEIESQSKKVSCSMSCKCYLISKRLSNEEIRVLYYWSGQENKIYNYIRFTLPSCVYSCVYFLLRCRMVGFNFAHELLCTTWVKTTEGLCKNEININHFAVRNRVKNSTNFVQEKWQLTGGGDRYLRKSLTLSWTRKLSESNSSSVLSV